MTSRTTQSALSGALVFLAAFSAHGWLIDAWGSPLPFWDQWDAEALRLYLPFERNALRFADLWAPHNEHRPVLGHVQNVLLMAANRRWDPLMQMIVNAVWHAFTALLVWTYARRTEVLPRTLLALSVVALFCAPFGWQNALWGFQSANYFTLLLGLVFALGMLLQPVFSMPWWVACVAGVLLPLSSGSALIFPLTVMAALCFVRFVCRTTSRSVWPGIAAGLLAGALAWFTRADAPHHAPLFAQNLQQFLHAWACSLAWPNIDIPVTVVIAQLPWIIWIVSTIRRRPGDSMAIRLTFWCGLLAILHAASIAYARGGGLLDGAPLSRYQEPLLLGALANVLALAQLRSGLTEAQRRRWKSFAALWTLVFVSGLVRLTYTNLGVHLPFKGRTDRIQIENLQAYMASRDPALFAEKSLWEISHTNVDNLRAVLDSVELSPRLPAALKPGTPLTLLERATRGAIAASPSVFVLSIGLLAFVLYRGRSPHAGQAPRHLKSQI